MHMYMFMLYNTCVYVYVFVCVCVCVCVCVDGIDPEDLIDEHEVIQTQPVADYQAIDNDKQSIPTSS